MFCVVWMNLIFNFTSGKPPPTKKLYTDSDFYHLLRESPDEEFVEVSVTGTQVLEGNVPCIIGCLTMNFAFYLVIFLSSFRMKMFIKKQKERMNAAKFKQTERQMNYILVAQGVLPAISLAVHTFTLSGYILFPETSIYFLLYLTIPVYWLPVVNPLSTMLIVKSYRNFLLEKVGRRRVQSQVTLTAVMSSPTRSRSDASVFAHRMTSFNEKDKRHTIH
ncbi:serpentine type 7TM GPCR chemoreceptor str domain-containing protein [Ditylenchus destructor]|nr:serpentine type 7TM GPCR chemoreceptor str domain-containing protein [Ditylenchus destructor]